MRTAMIMFKAKIRVQDCFSISHEYFLNGKRHREDGPAIEWSDGTYEYWINGRLHREDGPAAKYPLGGGEEFYLNGELFLESEWRKNLTCLK